MSFSCENCPKASTKPADAAANNCGGQGPESIEAVIYQDEDGELKPLYASKCPAAFTKYERVTSLAIRWALIHEIRALKNDHNRAVAGFGMLDREQKDEFDLTQPQLASDRYGLMHLINSDLAKQLK